LRLYLVGRVHSERDLWDLLGPLGLWGLWTLGCLSDLWTLGGLSDLGHHEDPKRHGHLEHREDREDHEALAGYGHHDEKSSLWEDKKSSGSGAIGFGEPEGDVDSPGQYPSEQNQEE